MMTNEEMINAHRNWLRVRVKNTLTVGKLVSTFRPRVMAESKFNQRYAKWYGVLQSDSGKFTIHRPIELELDDYDNQLKITTTEWRPDRVDKKDKERN
jgi:hypothetical protein